MTCSAVGCDTEPTHLITVKDGTGDTLTARVCDADAEHHRTVRQHRGRPSLAVQVTDDRPDWTYISIEPLNGRTA